MGGGADVAVVVQAGGELFVALVAEHELQDAGEVVEVLAGMPDIDDLGGLGELAGGDVPDLIPVPRLSRWCSVPARCGAVSVMRAGVIRGGRGSR
jgi:hypothetical protein